MISYTDALKLVHPDLNPDIKDPGKKIADLKAVRNDPKRIYELLMLWGVFEINYYQGDSTEAPTFYDTHFDTSKYHFSLNSFDDALFLVRTSTLQNKDEIFKKLNSIKHRSSDIVVRYLQYANVISKQDLESHLYQYYYKISANLYSLLIQNDKAKQSTLDKIWDSRLTGKIEDMMLCYDRLYYLAERAKLSISSIYNGVY